MENVNNNKPLEWHRDDLPPEKIDFSTNTKDQIVLSIGGRRCDNTYFIELMKNIPGITFEEACNRMSESMNQLNKRGDK